MSTRITEKTKKHLEIFFNMFKLMKNLSEPAEQKIFLIIKDKSTQGSEQRYQTISKITDILNSSKTEQEIIKKLDEIFPK